MLAAKASDFVDRRLRSLRDAESFLNTKKFFKRRQFWHPGKNKTAISTGSAAAANILFEQRDFGGRRMLFDAQCGPQTYVTAADDGDVRVERSL